MQRVTIALAITPLPFTFHLPPPPPPFWLDDRSVPAFSFVPFPSLAPLAPPPALCTLPPCCSFAAAGGPSTTPSDAFLEPRIRSCLHIRPRGCCPRILLKPRLGFRCDPIPPPPPRPSAAALEVKTTRWCMGSSIDVSAFPCRGTSEDGMGMGTAAGTSSAVQSYSHNGCSAPIFLAWPSLSIAGASLSAAVCALLASSRSLHRRKILFTAPPTAAASGRRHPVQ
ncbi:hypothetical protein C8R45DRAFT_118818 [Mycena sanguinolenta]|nr:hypothetical protein C8R45DRAFT_118818 [Mycena sanguinolenta]